MERSPRPVRRPPDLETRVDPRFAPQSLAELSPDQLATTPGGGNTWLRDLIRRGHRGPYDRNHAPQLPEGADPEQFRVPEGQLTFDAEGTEGGAYHSRTAHRPPGASGVTIGRGYDVGQHGAGTVIDALVGAGLTPAQAEAFRPAAGLRGDAAQRWFDANRGSLPAVTPAQQKALFATTYDGMEADVARISSKPDTVARYGEVDLETVDPAIRDLVVDLRYRGDYTPASRRDVQPLLVGDDLPGLAALMADRSEWASVPPDRFARRRDYAQEAVEERQIEDAMIFFGERLERLGDAAYDLFGRRKG